MAHKASTSLFLAGLFIIASAVLSSSSFAGQSDDNYLNVSISIFDANLPESELTQKQLNIYPEVRNAEARYIPALLRATLLESDLWGAIRIIPEIDPSAELMISGTIIHSDGLRLEVNINAVDSTGLQWVNQIYTSDSDNSISLS